MLLGCHNKDTSLLDGFSADRITRAPRGPSALRPLAGSPQLGDEDDAEEEAEALAEGVITAHLRICIRIDAQRTRHAMHGSPTLVDELEQLLVFYCHSLRSVCCASRSSICEVHLYLRVRSLMDCCSVFVLSTLRPYSHAAVWNTSRV